MIRFLILGCSCLFGLGMLTCQKTPKSDDMATPIPGLTSEETNRPQGLSFSVGAISASSEEVSQATSAQAEPLASDREKALLGRLPNLPKDRADQDFAMRASSRPAPRPGKTIEADFPPKQTRAAPQVSADEPLKVVRFAPEGEVDLGASINLTFSQPMVPLAAHDDLAERTLPVTMQPVVEGQWRWVGSKTLVFDGPSRLPMATRYQLEVPAGTRSELDQSLSAPHRWEFTTPPVEVTSFYPNGQRGQTRTPVMVAQFNQRIDQASLLAHISLISKGKMISLRLADEDEIAKDPRASQQIKIAKKGRWLAFTVTEPLPLDSQVDVRLGPNLPSAEGPLTSPGTDTYTFHTYGPFKVVETRCGWREGDCRPGTPFYFRFSNDIDQNLFDPAMVRAEPAIEGMQTSVAGNSLTITGVTQALTTYQITLAKNLTDRFGQTLGEEVSHEFKVGEPYPVMHWQYREMTVLDPAAPPSISMFTAQQGSARVKLYRVKPKQYGDYLKILQNQRFSNGQVPGELVYDQKLILSDTKGQVIETLIDLRPALDEGLGHVIATVTPAKSPNKRLGRAPRNLMTWIQATKLAVDAVASPTKLVAWTGKLENGRPIENLELRLAAIDTMSKALSTLKSSADGTATFPLPASSNQKHVLVARQGKDVAFLPENYNWWHSGQEWYKQVPGSNLATYFINDRGIYRPGEKVHFKGWLRQIKPDKAYQPQAADQVASISFQANDSRGNTFKKGTLKLSLAHGFSFKLDLPDDINLGSASVQLTAHLANGAIQQLPFHSFRVEEFRRPEYEVTVAKEEGPFLIGSSTDVSLTASYFAGGGLIDAEVDWQVQANQTQYQPPNHGDYIFGQWIPWWRFHQAEQNTTSQNFQGKTDALGKHAIRLDLVEANPTVPYILAVTGSVTDVNAQRWSGNTQLLVHPGEYYVGLRSQRQFVNKGTPFEIEAVVADIDGKRINDAVIDVLVTRSEWRFAKGHWKNVDVDPQEFELKSAAEPVAFRFKTEKGGSYRVTARVRDPQGRLNQSSMTRWVSGGSFKPVERVEKEQVTIIPDKQTYTVGDTAEIMIQAPFFPAEGLMIVQTYDFERVERFSFEETTHVLTIPIKETHVPGFHLRVEVVGSAPRNGPSGAIDKSLPPRPAYAGGSLDLLVPPTHKNLQLTVTPAAEQLAPGANTHVTVAVADKTGTPVSDAEVALLVVDEAILALTGYAYPEPWQQFYTMPYGRYQTTHSRELIVLKDPSSLLQAMNQVKEDLQRQEMDGAPRRKMAGRSNEMLAMPMSAPMEESKMVGEGGAENQPIAMRKNFNPLAVFVPAERSDAQGKVRFDFTLPDNLTRYRVVALAASGFDRFGKSESQMTARLPMMLRPSPPRFLNFGDSCELPLVIQNQTDQTMTVSLAARAQNATFTEGASRRFQVPANDRVEIRLPVTTVAPGTARFQVAVTTDGFSDATEFSLPVWTPATSEAFATYGQIDRDLTLSQTVQMPSKAFSQFGGLEITTSSTALQALTDAFLYLRDYPFDCSEQISSRILAVAGLRDVLSAFDKDMNLDTVNQSVARDLKTLAKLQNYDGGFGFWAKGDKSWPFTTIHVAHAMARAKQKGYEVEPNTWNRAKRYLQQIENHTKDYPPRYRFTLGAYAIFTLHQMGEKGLSKSDTIFNSIGLEEAPMEGLGWLLPVVNTANRERILRHFENRTAETAATAQFTTQYGDDAYLILHSSRRDDAVILESLIATYPDHDLIPKVVKGLLAHRVKGRWNNTQENCFVLLAMDRYFATYERQTPDFVASVWLGDQFAGDAQFKGRSSDSHQIDIPMAWLNQHAKGQAPLLLAKQGPGRLYYRLGMRYAPKNLLLESADHGFFVTRSYEAVDDSSEVTRDSEGRWHIKRGARVRVRLNMVAPARRYHVALVDPLPAGLEIQNPDLAVTEANPADQSNKRRGWWFRQWFSHQNLRDERAEAFATLVYPGVYEYTYVARATTPGTFVVAPAKAEEMYHPETFGRGASAQVIIQ